MVKAAESTPKEDLLFSNRELVSRTIPLVLSSLLTTLTGVVDSVMVSSAGEAAVSAISLVSSIMVIFLLLISAATHGGTVLTTQYVGKGDMISAEDSAKQLTYLSFFAGLFMAVVLTFFNIPILRVAYSSVEADVFENCREYLLFLSWGFPFFAIGSSCSSILRTIGKNTLSVSLTFGMNALNVIGDAILIYV
ncbi:MAG: hypothetical protein IIV97_04210, partial [Oscillospiraceae bacterium]|nr:hypothetical protein [Oscillospiraceae bacterium]